jgi:hypothetical protein
VPVTIASKIRAPPEMKYSLGMWQRENGKEQRTNFELGPGRCLARGAVKSTDWHGQWHDAAPLEPEGAVVDQVCEVLDIFNFIKWQLLMEEDMCHHPSLGR